LEIVQRCVYLDKDLVLPPIGTSGSAADVFCRSLHRPSAFRDYVHAHPGTTGTRRRPQNQMHSNHNHGSSAVAARRGERIARAAGSKVASCVTKMILNSMERKHLSAGKSAQRAN